MLQIWDFGRLGLQTSNLGLASESPTVRERSKRDSRWLVVAGVAATCVPVRERKPREKSEPVMSLDLGLFKPLITLQVLHLYKCFSLNLQNSNYYI